MNKIKDKVQESPGVQFAKAMLESQRQTHKEILEEYNNPISERSKMLEELKKRNAERGTPVVKGNSFKNQKRKVMNTAEKTIVESPGVQLAKRMLESQRQTAREIMEQYNNPNSEFRKSVEKLKKENAERETPVIQHV